MEQGRVAGNGEVGRVSLSLVSPGHHPVSLSRRRFLSLRCVFRGKRPSLVDGPSHGLQLSPNPSTPLHSAPLRPSVGRSVGRSAGRSVDRSFRPSPSLPPPPSLFPSDNPAFTLAFPSCPLFATVFRSPGVVGSFSRREPPCTPYTRREGEREGERKRST